MNALLYMLVNEYGYYYTSFFKLNSSRKIYILTSYNLTNSLYANQVQSFKLFWLYRISNETIICLKSISKACNCLLQSHLARRGYKHKTLPGITLMGCTLNGTSLGLTDIIRSNVLFFFWVVYMHDPKKTWTGPAPRLRPMYFLILVGIFMSAANMLVDTLLPKVWKA